MTPDSPDPLDPCADDQPRATDLDGSAEHRDVTRDETSAVYPSEGDDPETADAVSAFVDAEIQNRLWLKTLVPLLQLRSQETDPSDRVQYALDLMYIAACERIARILRSDLPPDRG
jgi:hypothetical protein